MYSAVKSKAFATDLQLSVKRNSEATKRSYLADVVTECLAVLNEPDSLEEKGLYRVPGGVARIRTLKENYDAGIEVDVSEESVHDLASLFKQYLRELPTPILSEELVQTITGSLDDDEAIITALGGVDEYSLALLYVLMKHLCAVVARKDVNKMNEGNICIVFSPTTQIPQELIQTFLERFDAIFTKLEVRLEAPEPVASMAESGDTSTSKEEEEACKARIAQVLAYNAALQSAIDNTQEQLEREKKTTEDTRAKLDALGEYSTSDMVYPAMLSDEYRNHALAQDILQKQEDLQKLWESISSAILENLDLKSRLTLAATDGHT